MKDIFGDLGIKPGIRVKFKVKGRVCSGLYPMDGHGYVESILGNGILIRTNKGYAVTIHDWEIMCKDVVLTILPKKIALS